MSLSNTLLSILIKIIYVQWSIFTPSPVAPRLSLREINNRTVQTNVYVGAEFGWNSGLLKRKILVHYVLVEQSTQVLHFVERKPVMNKREQ